MAEINNRSTGGPDRANPGVSAQRIRLGSAGRKNDVPEQGTTVPASSALLLDQPAGLTTSAGPRRVAGQIPRRNQGLPGFGRSGVVAFQSR